jgi:hypothetical protein
LVGVSPDDEGVSTERPYEIADELREEHDVNAEIAWREEGQGAVLYFKPWMENFEVTAAHLHALRKARDEGKDAFDLEERALCDEMAELTRAMLSRIPPGAIEAMDKAHRAFEQLSPADQSRYGDWQPEELLAFLPLIAPNISLDDD